MCCCWGTLSRGTNQRPLKSSWKFLNCWRRKEDARQAGGLEGFCCLSLRRGRKSLRYDPLTTSSSLQLMLLTRLVSRTKVGSHKLEHYRPPTTPKQQKDGKPAGMILHPCSNFLKSTLYHTLYILYTIDHPINQTLESTAHLALCTHLLGPEGSISPVDPSTKHLSEDLNPKLKTSNKVKDLKVRSASKISNLAGAQPDVRSASLMMASSPCGVLGCPCENYMGDEALISVAVFVLPPLVLPDSTGKAA